MPLNIYTISHPIIQLLSSLIVNRSKNHHTCENIYRYIGFLFIYETLRKYIKIEKLYIKNMYSIKNFYLIDPKTKYYIFTDLSENYKLITEIKILLPNIEVIHVDYKNNDKINKKTKDYIDNIGIRHSNINIFIIDEIINNEKIIKLIKSLEIQTKISLQNINLACIACYDEILYKLGIIYPKLKIYTTKIIYNSI